MKRIVRQGSKEQNKSTLESRYLANNQYLTFDRDGDILKLVPITRSDGSVHFYWIHINNTFIARKGCYQFDTAVLDKIKEGFNVYILQSQDELIKFLKEHNPEMPPKKTGEGFSQITIKEHTSFVCDDNEILLDDVLFDKPIGLEGLNYKGYFICIEEKWYFVNFDCARWVFDEAEQALKHVINQKDCKLYEFESQAELAEWLVC